jgi:diguanylate cyclase
MVGASPILSRLPLPAGLNLRWFRPIRRSVISLKRHIELHPGRVLDSTLAAYRAALLAMGTYGSQACPAVGFNLRHSLVNLQASLWGNPTESMVVQTKEGVEQELKKWGESASGYYRDKANEIKEIMLVLAGAAETMAQRDQQYAGQFGEMTERLQAAADLEDISAVRQSIVENASLLRSCIDRMTHDSQESIRRLQSKLSVFQARFEEADRVASRDELTGLGNRRYMETQMENRIAMARPFSVMVIDLDGFKKVNDTYGHLAGDDLLKQFATELRTSLRAADVVARWGGDEFVALLDCDSEAAPAYVDRIQKWVVGDYVIHARNGTHKIPMTAAAGLAAWKPGESAQAVFDRADKAMYTQKKHAKG